MRPTDSDEAHIFALEAVLVAGLLLGAVALVVMTPRPGQSGAAFAAQTADLASDVLTVLESRPADSDAYRSLLHQYVTEAYLGDPSSLTNYLNRTVPDGAEYGIYMDNGEDIEIIFETSTPVGVVESRDLVFYPDWNYAMVFSTMDRQPGAAITTENVCTPPPIVICTPTTTASVAGSMRVKVIPVKHSYLDRDIVDDQHNLAFDNGKNFTLDVGSDGILFSGLVDPEAPGALNGFETPYTLTDATSYYNSVVATGLGAPAGYGVNTSLPLTLVGEDIVYRVHPDYVVDAALQTFLDSQPRVTTTETKVKPGQSATINYDFTGLPLGVGWAVQSREIHIYGPVLGHEIANEALPALAGTFTYDLPRNALYGTYIVEVRLGLANADTVQTVHDVTAFDVLRRGVDEPVPPVYRAVVAIWFPGLDE